MTDKKAIVTVYASPRSLMFNDGKSMNACQSEKDAKLGVKGRKEAREDKKSKKVQVVEAGAECQPAYISCVDRLYGKMQQRDAKVLALRQSVEDSDLETS